MRRGLPAIAGLGLALVMPVTVCAEIKDYQVRRMLMLKTECTVIDIETSVKDGQDRFVANCENVSHYPEGVEILCPVTDDDRECRIVTRKREFRHLHHLRP